jgi:aminoglycoside phosphotransferase (APT) family kinase protein
MIPAELFVHIPGCSDGHPPRAVQVLPGGFGRNEVLRIDTAEGRFVWRRRLDALDRPGALALTELTAHRLAAKAQLAPAIVAAASDGRWILMDYVDAPPWRDEELYSPGGIQRLGGQLARLHALAIPDALPTADAVGMARGYLARIAARDPAAVAVWEPMLERLQSLSTELEAAGQRRVLVHGDLMASNLLGPQPLMVDWEYAQVADPTWDCACLLSYYPFLQSRLALLLASAGLDIAAYGPRLALQQERFVLLNRLWSEAYPPPGRAPAG